MRRPRAPSPLRAVGGIGRERNDIGCRAGPATKNYPAAAAESLAIENHGAAQRELRRHVQRQHAANRAIPRKRGQRTGQRGGAVLRNANDLKRLYALRWSTGVGRGDAGITVQQAAASAGAHNRYAVGASVRG